MYHPAKFITTRLLAAGATSLLLAANASVASFTERSPIATGSLNGKLSFITADYPSPPVGKLLKKKPSVVSIYQYDAKPLGDRTPFLFVHGLHGEFFPYFRWQRVVKRFISDDRFASQYKVYLLRYDSTARLDVTVPEFRREIARLSQQCQQRPVTIMALSLGGNLVYEGMLDKQTDDQVKLAFTLGTPFRGSPLFCEDWVKYSIYKNLCFPWTRIDHSLAYDLYFAKNHNLLDDLRWDDVDGSVPQVGEFKSNLPLGPRGSLTISDTINDRLKHLEHKSFDKKKLIAYSGYLLNPYMLPDSARFVETTVMAPYTMLFMKVPAHLAREHPVLKLLNRQISSVVPSQESAERAGTRFVYQLNDGITPVVSALFLPPEACESINKESDLTKLHNTGGLKMARVFRNIDHLTYIDGYRPLRAESVIRDELNPNEPPKQIFDWMLSDLLNATTDDSTLAKESLAPNSIPQTRNQ